MGVFRPDYIDPDPGLLARLGRLLHWIGICLAFVAVLSGAWGFLATADGETRLIMLSAGGVFAAGFFIAGRAARYLFAGE